METGGRISDAVQGHWTEVVLPARVLPYAQLARLDRPTGWWLLVLPCWWSVALSDIVGEKVSPSFYFIFLFWAGAVVMRGAGCAFNDIVDREIDRQTPRTRSRPIASGRVTALEAWMFIVVLCVLGLVVLLQFTTNAILLGLLSLLFVGAYPFMKRITNWPQFFLGFTYAFGVLLGWASGNRELSLTPLLLFCGTVLWVVAFDSIYAHQDSNEDRLNGVGSTAIVFGKNTKAWLASLFAGTIICLAASFSMAGCGPVAFVALAAGAIHLILQVIALDIDQSHNCLSVFRSNRDFGLIIFFGLLFDTLL